MILGYFIFMQVNLVYNVKTNMLKFKRGKLEQDQNYNYKASKFVFFG